MGTESKDPSSNATTLGIPTRNTVNDKDLTFTVVISSLEDHFASSPESHSSMPRTRACLYPQDRPQFLVLCKHIINMCFIKRAPLPTLISYNSATTIHCFVLGPLTVRTHNQTAFLSGGDFVALFHLKHVSMALLYGLYFLSLHHPPLPCQTMEEV